MGGGAAVARFPVAFGSPLAWANWPGFWRGLLIVTSITLNINRGLKNPPFLVIDRLGGHATSAEPR